MTALLLVLLLGQPDTLIVSVELTQTDRVLVQAVLDADSTLHLPAEPIGRLLGASFPAPWITLAALRHAFPTVRFAWIPRELRLVILDDLRVFPASRAAHQQVLARHQMTLGIAPQSGPFLAFAVDDSLHGLVDVGYNHRGRVSVGALVDDAGTALWNLTAAPSSHLFLNYSDGVHRPPYVSGRAAAGPLWLSVAYTPSLPLDVSGLVRLGPVQFFGSRQYAVITFQPTGQLVVQASRSWLTNRSAARISYGPVPASPFSFPVTSISPRR